jgi:hypothetical protein
MAKKRIIKRKKTVSKTARGVNVEFHSWTFFIFLLFVLLAAMMLLAQQEGVHLLRIF